MKRTISRRRFLGEALAAGAAFTIVPRHVLGGPGFTPPSEVLTRAVIGTGGMGMAGHVTSNREGEPAILKPNPWSADREAALSPNGFSFITNATSESFTFRIARGEPFPFGVTISEDQANSRRWRVSWTGIEPVAGSEPALDLARVFSLASFPIAKLALFGS